VASSSSDAGGKDNQEQTLFKDQPQEEDKIKTSLFAGCDEPISEGRGTKFLIGQLYDSGRAPRAESGK
jgi:hypothetical protein